MTWLLPVHCFNFKEVTSRLSADSNHVIKQQGSMQHAARNSTVAVKEEKSGCVWLCETVTLLVMKCSSILFLKSS